MISTQTAKALQESIYYQEFEAHLKDMIELLDSCANIPDEWTPEQKAVEVTARKRAQAVLYRIFEPMQLQSNGKEKEDKMKKYGLD